MLEAKETAAPAAEALGVRPPTVPEEPPHGHDFEERYRQATDGEGRMLH